MPVNPDFRDLFSALNEGDVEYLVAGAHTVMAGLTGVDFASAWGERTESTYGEVPIHIMGRDTLIQAKKACGRPQDLLDLGKLQ